MTKGAEQVARAEQEALAVRLRRDGFGYRDIGTRLGCSPSTAHRMVTRVLRRLPVDSVRQLRAIEGDRLDALHSALWPAASAGDEKAAAVFVKVSAQRSRLLGLELIKDDNKRPVTIVIDPLVLSPPTLTPEAFQV